MLGVFVLLNLKAQVFSLFRKLVFLSFLFSLFGTSICWMWDFFDAAYSSTCFWGNNLIVVAGFFFFPLVSHF